MFNYYSGRGSITFSQSRYSNEKSKIFCFKEPEYIKGDLQYLELELQVRYETFMLLVNQRKNKQKKGIIT